MSNHRPPSDPSDPAHYRPAAASSPEAEDGLGLSAGEIFGVLRRRKWLVLGCTVVSTVLTAYLLAQQTTLYRASALVRFVDDGGAVAGEFSEATSQGSSGARTDPLQSQLLVLRGQDVVGPVVEAEGLRLIDQTSGEVPAYVRDVQITLPADSAAPVELHFGGREIIARSLGEERRAAYGDTLVLGHARFVIPSPPELSAASLVIVPSAAAMMRTATGISAGPRSGTDALDVGFTSPDPRLALRLANAVVEQFQIANAEAAKELDTRRRVFLRSQLRETDSLLAIAQSALIDFRNEQQVYGSSQQLDALMAGILQLETRREELNADRLIYVSLLEKLQESADQTSEAELAALVSSPQLASNSLISQLVAQRRQYVSVRDSLTVGLGRGQEDLDVQRASTMIDHTRGRLLEAARSQIEMIEARIASLDELKAQNEAEFRRLPAVEAEELRLGQQVATLQQVSEQLRSEYQRARIAEAVENGRVEILNPAREAMPVSGRRAMKLMLGLMFGLFLGSGGAFLLENMNTSIRRRDEMATTLHIPELGVIPAARRQRPKLAGRRGADAQQPALDNRALMSESYRMLRTNLTHRPESQAVRVLAVTSASSGEGKTTTAINLAVSYAQQGARVLLVDCDLWRSRLAKTMNVPASPGLTDALGQQSSPEESIHPSMVEGLDVLPCGSRAEHGLEVLNTPRMDGLLRWLRGQYDLLILDTPPVLALSDTAALATRADGVLMVVRAGSTDRAIAQAAVQQLVAVGANVVGGVLNDPDAEVPRYGGYYGLYERSYAVHG